jgi:hypothetical protein
MLERVLDKNTGIDAQTRSLRSSDRRRFAEVFGRSIVLFLQLPPGYENGIDPKISQDEFLAHVRACAEDLSQREQFTPFWLTLGGRRSLLLFTQQSFAQEFAHIYVREVRRIMPFVVVGVRGRTAVRMFDGVDSVTFNAGTKHECELPADDLNLLRELFPQTRPEPPRQQ